MFYRDFNNYLRNLETIYNYKKLKKIFSTHTLKLYGVKIRYNIEVLIMEKRSYGSEEAYIFQIPNSLTR